MYNYVPHRIDTGDTIPIRQPARQLPPVKMSEAMKQFMRCTWGASSNHHQDGIYCWKGTLAILCHAIWSLQCSKATSELLMEQVLAGLPLSVCLVYIDTFSKTCDLVESETFVQSSKGCRKQNSELSLQKCTLLQQQIKYLGHIISRDGVATDASVSLVNFLPYK